MPEDTAVTCPHCGTTSTLPVVFENVTIAGVGTNIGVDYPSCGRTFEAAPGSGSGTFSTVGGRLQRVKTLVERLESQNPPHSAEELAVEIEGADSRLQPLADWVRQHQDLVTSSLVQAVITILTTLITQTLMSPPPPPPPGISPVQFERLIDELQEPPAAQPKRSEDER